MSVSAYPYDPSHPRLRMALVLLALQIRRDSGRARPLNSLLAVRDHSFWLQLSEFPLDCFFPREGTFHNRSASARFSRDFCGFRFEKWKVCSRDLRTPSLKVCLWRFG